jgi:hypothetical protein
MGWYRTAARTCLHANRRKSLDTSPSRSSQNRMLRLKLLHVTKIWASNQVDTYMTTLPVVYRTKLSHIFIYGVYICSFGSLHIHWQEFIPSWQLPVSSACCPSPSTMTTTSPSSQATRAVSRLSELTNEPHPSTRPRQRQASHILCSKHIVLGD